MVMDPLFQLYPSYIRICDFFPFTFLFLFNSVKVLSSVNLILSDTSLRPIFKTF